MRVRVRIGLGNIFVTWLTVINMEENLRVEGRGAKFRAQSREKGSFCPVLPFLSLIHCGRGLGRWGQGYRKGHPAVGSEVKVSRWLCM